MDFRKLKILVLSLALIAVLGCGASQPNDDAAREPAAADQPEAEKVFEEDFEAGDVEDWTEAETPAEESQEEAAEDPDPQ